MPLSFEPRLDILPESQRKVWPQLDDVPSHFVLYGGTGIALQLGHRNSEDFDFSPRRASIRTDSRLDCRFLKSWKHQIRMLGCIANQIISRPSPTWAEDL
jgi:hypothetical protein